LFYNNIPSKGKLLNDFGEKLTKEPENIFLLLIYKMFDNFCFIFDD